MTPVDFRMLMRRLDVVLENQSSLAGMIATLDAGGPMVRERQRVAKNVRDRIARERAMPS